MSTTTVKVHSLLQTHQEAAGACAKSRATLDALLTTQPLLGDPAGQRIRLWLEILSLEAFAGRDVRAEWVVQAKAVGTSDASIVRLEACFNRPRDGTLPCVGLLDLARAEVLEVAKAAKLDKPVEQQLDEAVAAFAKHCAWTNVIRQDLIQHTAERIEVLSRKMLRRDFPKVRGIAQTGDISVGATMRLMRALRQVSPADPRAFFGLASLQIRRELIDLARQIKKDYQSDELLDPNPDPRPDNPRLAECWTRFHEAVEKLPPDQKEVVDLHWYQELTLEEIAEIVGVDKSTSKRRWRAARESLARDLEDCVAVILAG